MLRSRRKKIKLIEEAIAGNNSKAIKNVEKKTKKADANLVQKEEHIGKINKKDKKKNEAKKTVTVQEEILPENKQNKTKTPKLTNVKNLAKATEDIKPNKNNKLKQATAATKPKKNLQNNPKAALGPFLKGKKKKQAGPKKEKKPYNPETIFEPLPFDEDQFNAVVNLKNISKIGKALKAMVKKEVTDTKKSIFEDYRYLLTICCYKIANCPKRMVKLNLCHSLVDTNEDDVAIIVPDLQRGAKVDYEATIQHYEDLFRESGISGLKIIPFNQLRKECTTYEAKHKFSNSYDYFLCDGRIVGHVVGFAGSHFQKSRSTFHSVKLGDKKTIKRDIEKALKRTAYRQLQKGDLTTIPVGNHRFTIDKLAQNINLVVEQLKTVYPGGLANIRNMNIKTDITGTSALPLYFSIATAPENTPSVIGMREQRLLKLKKEANEVLTQFNMSKSGEFVKLDKKQAERKRKIIEARQALLAVSSDSFANADDEDAVPAKKLKNAEAKESVQGEKKQKALKKQKQNKEKDEEENEEDEDDVETIKNGSEEDDENDVVDEDDDDETGEDDDDDNEAGDDDDEECSDDE